MKINHAIIMAAGRGARMMPLTKKIPKAMAILKGRTLVERGINILKKKVKNLHITVGYKGDLLASHVISNGVKTVINTNNKGNSWWVFNSLLKNINEPILVLTCDNVINIDIKFLLNEYKKLNYPPCMLVAVKPDTRFEGDYIFLNSKNHVKQITRKKVSNFYASGIQILNPLVVNSLIKKTDNFNTLWKRLIVKKKLNCSSIYQKKWLAIDNLKQLRYLNK